MTAKRSHHSERADKRDGFDRLGSHALPALAFLELSSISRGLYLTDVVLKKAPVRVIASLPISSGKHIILFAADVAAVEESLQAAVNDADGTILKTILIPGVHESLGSFLDSLWSQEPRFEAPRSGEEDSVGIVESTMLAGAIIAADRALKAAHVSLNRFRLGQGIGGKAYFVLSGAQEEVEAALEAASDCLKDLESLCRVDLIPRPLDEALAHF